MTYVKAYTRSGRRVKAHYRIVHRVGGVHTLQWAKMVRALVREGFGETAAYRIATARLGKKAFNKNVERPS
jgi:hypothetical protein